MQTTGIVSLRLIAHSKSEYSETAAVSSSFQGRGPLNRTVIGKSEIAGVLVVARVATYSQVAVAGVLLLGEDGRCKNAWHFALRFGLLNRRREIEPDDGGSAKIESLRKV